MPKLTLIGVKRNAERYMFSEPRPPVDALRARIREPRFSVRDVLPDVIFWSLLRKVHFGAQKCTFGSLSAF